VFGSKTSEIKLQVSESKKALELSSSDHVAGENTYLLPAKVDGEPKAIVFNWRYLTDGVRALSTPEVHIGFSKEENKPAVIKSPHDMSYFYVAMPIFKA
ncbi:MAG: hypothetical protein HY436_00665, partial [Candidatus Liptonbacteria bacterium]|nr:hypothetical protein [Candidatus Liptonbacteria bacterium]